MKTKEPSEAALDRAVARFKKKYATKWQKAVDRIGEMSAEQSLRGQLRRRISPREIRIVFSKPVD